jgi:hypothetical protein
MDRQLIADLLDYFSKELSGRYYWEPALIRRLMKAEADEKKRQDAKDWDARPLGGFAPDD